MDRLPSPKLIPAVRPAHGRLPPVYVCPVYEPSRTHCHCPIAIETYAVPYILWDWISSDRNGSCHEPTLEPKREIWSTEQEHPCDDDDSMHHLTEKRRKATTRCEPSSVPFAWHLHGLSSAVAINHCTPYGDGTGR
jgi:hypothetical protein